MKIEHGDRTACLHAVACMSNCLAKAYDRLTDDSGVIAFWLLDAVERHFSAEESLLRKNPARLERHRELHRDLIRLISRHTRPGAAAGTASVEKLVSEIQEWVLKHGGDPRAAEREPFEKSAGVS